MKIDPLKTVKSILKAVRISKVFGFLIIKPIFYVYCIFLLIFIAACDSINGFGSLRISMTEATDTGNFHNVLDLLDLSEALSLQNRFNSR